MSAAPHLAITALGEPAPGSAANEIVERKGLGHPDSLCDALAENLSIGLSRFYLERFGEILHHNVDKALLLGAAARQPYRLADHRACARGRRPAPCRPGGDRCPSAARRRARAHPPATGEPALARRARGSLRGVLMRS